jgi:LAO/AO transport system kinase
LVEALEQHRAYLLKTGELALRQRERARAELESLLRDQLAARWRVAQPDGRFDAALERVVRREVAPRRAAADLAETGKG